MSWYSLRCKVDFFLNAINSIWWTLIFYSYKEIFLDPLQTSTVFPLYRKWLRSWFLNSQTMQPSFFLPYISSEVYNAERLSDVIYSRRSSPTHIHAGWYKLLSAYLQDSHSLLFCFMPLICVLSASYQFFPLDHKFLIYIMQIFWIFNYYFVCVMCYPLIHPNVKK